MELGERLRRSVGGCVLDSRADCGRYATDASHYQVVPRAVVLPGTTEDLRATLAVCGEAGVPVTMRGGGTSQCGQTVNDGVIVDVSRHLDRLIAVDPAARTCVVEPGIVLDELNRRLRPHGLWFPVDISTSSRATLGGMAANNSCGGRSLRYGTMRDNVIAIDAVLADGMAMRFGPDDRGNTPDSPLVADLLGIAEGAAGAIRARTPQVQRRVGGYGLETLLPERSPHNPAGILIGSEGTLAVTERLTLKLSPLIGPSVMGVCHFATFRAAMEAAQHIVRLGPLGVELVDRTMIELARDIPIYARTIEQVVRGDPAATLIVEFSGETDAANGASLRDLEALMGDLGLGWDGSGARWGGVVAVVDRSLQSALSEVRKGGLNIVMSMKTAGKPVSFVEDCAVPLEHLADYTERLSEIFARHGTTGTWYAHASVGCLHVRPILNLKLERDVAAMRAIAEEAFELVRGYKGSHSGEHGDGIVRSEFHEAMFGPEMVAAFRAVKARFDPARRLNPGRIVDAPRMDDRTLLRYTADYAASDFRPALDWSAWQGGAAGFQGAVEMCNNNGACRKLAGGVMCPSFRATRDERDSTRGRANTLRLALSGQLGPDALVSDEMAATLSLCVSCKACRRECPTGVDMARMKIEVLAARAERHGIGLRDRLVANLPRYAPVAARLRHALNLADALPGAGFMRGRLGLTARRRLPRWSRAFREPASAEPGRPIAVFADTFTRHFEPHVLHAAFTVLGAAGFAPRLLRAQDGGRLCCGRTYLAAGLVNDARREAQRCLDAIAPLAEAGVLVVGLEPSCLLTFRDEAPAMLPGEAARKAAQGTLLLEELLHREMTDGRSPPFGTISSVAHVHAHCHQKAFGTMGALEAVLGAVPGLSVRRIESSCCGMAGAFGYQAETEAISRRMGEAALAPAVRAARAEDWIVAGGTSCRHQIADLTDRKAVHLAEVLAAAVAAKAEG